MERFEELAAGYLDGLLSVIEEEELVALVRSEPALRHRFVALAEMEGILRAHFLADDGRQAFVQRAMLCLPDAQRREETVDRVLARIANEPAPRSQAPRSARTVRMFDWRPWALAAAVLLVLAAVGYNWFGRSSVDEQRRNLVALAFSAVLDSSAGEVFCLGEYNESRYEVFAGQPLAARMGIETVGVARADIKFRDGTVMTLTSAEGGSTRLWLRRLATLEPVGREVSAGKRVTLEAGTLEMHAAKQPEHEPLIVCTPHGEARVVGTKFRLVVTPDATRLEVREGSVKLSRRADGSSVVVAAMQFAATGPAAGMAAQPLPAVPAPQTPEAKQP